MFGIAWSTWVVVGSLVVLTLLIFAAIARMIRKAGPNEALIVYGFRGTRVVKGHGTVIFPMVETCRQLSLELMSFDVAPQQDLYTKQGVAVHGRGGRADQGQVGPRVRSRRRPSSSSPRRPTSAKASSGS